MSFHKNKMVQLWPPNSHWRWPKWNKYSQCWRKVSVIGLSKYVKIKARPLLPFSEKMRLIFAIFWLGFQVWLLFLVPRLHIWKNELDYLMQNSMLNRLASILNLRSNAKLFLHEEIMKTKWLAMRGKHGFKLLLVLLRFRKLDEKN